MNVLRSLAVAVVTAPMVVVATPQPVLASGPMLISSITAQPAAALAKPAPAAKPRRSKAKASPALLAAVQATARLAASTYLIPRPRKVHKPVVATVLTVATLPQPWRALAWCESGRDGSWRISSSSYARGRFQFEPPTWRWMGGHGDPAAAPLTEQLMRARRLLRAQGWAAWPTCSRELGLR